jgi:hypothetical protein
MKDKILCKMKSSFLPFSICNITPYIVIIILLLMVLSSCSTIERKDDAVRIKSGKENKFREYKDKNNNVISRDGTTLRGTVYKILQETTPNSCPIVDTTSFSSKYYVIFLDEQANSESQIEKIPIEVIDLIGQKLELAEKLNNRYNNINWFENFNDPLDPQAIREVPVDSFFINNCPEVIDCNCNPISVALELNCPDCEYKNYFLELRGGYSVYTDRNSAGLPIGRDSYYGELALGYRNDSWGIGIMASTGVPVYNSRTDEDLFRPLLMLHGRKQFDEILCMFPFAYAQFGFTMDAQSLDLFKAYSCELPDVNLPKVSLPISYGFGFGVDIPLPMCLFDISFDLGYKSVLVGETFNTLLFNNVSDTRRINMLVFRLGITLGY